MLRTANKDIQAMADKYQRPAYLVRVTDCASGREFCEEECVTTDKREADAWAKQWRGEYDKESGYTLTRRTFQPVAQPVAEEKPAAAEPVKQNADCIARAVKVETHVWTQNDDKRVWQSYNLRDGFDGAGVDCMDAPEFIPTGSHVAYDGWPRVAEVCFYR
jgi:hypothetical protein